MKIYFSCSITGGRSEEKIYQALVKDFLAENHEVPTAHLSSPEVVVMDNIVDPVEIYERDMAWLKDCDVVIAEVTSPSHGVGYEVACGLMMEKPVLCLYQKGKKISKIITGNTSPTLTVGEYEDEEQAISLARRFLQKFQ